MPDIEEVHCGAAIQAVIQANLQLLDATVEEALEPIAYGKKDTLGLDGIPESAIAHSLKDFDRGVVLVTEEVGAAGGPHRRPQRKHYPPTFYLSDPTDRSSQLREFLSQQDPSRRVGDVIEEAETPGRWERSLGGPASIAGATSAITSIRYGVPIATAIVNFITQELFVAARTGAFRLRLPRYTDLDPGQITPAYVRAKGDTVQFRTFKQSGMSFEQMRYFVTFLGKSGYEENFRDSHLIPADDAKKYLRYNLPGGPSRPLYLSTLQPESQPIGFVLANGEKIGEWIHWVPFIRFGTTEGDSTRHGLRLYEIHQERPWTKEGILMATPPPYSIFTSAEEHEGKLVIDIERLRSFSNPSLVRSTLLVAPATNTWAITVMARNLYREIDFADPR